ncbi:MULTISPECIES: TetR/AcrR family transcriptional regulator [unclassified Clostridium]|uniref:TetR/AcrR family transcriptional regulator n=1 Tax=unclassified Clostridium TaxID=2614128 RepID=UPI00290B0A27|nr:TetR/AcrR family transcriptional regulator [Clostridium sp.]MDU5105687.1 TetR/AcrR family transcriptional regulator [Clostridium sp.]
MRELKGIEEKILDKALYLFGKNGTTNVPIRSIVKEAEVNISAINYYFNSKENMMNYVKEFYLENITQAHAALYDESLSDEEKLIKCSNEIIEYCLRYPGVLVMNKEAASAIEKSEMDIKIIERSKEENIKLYSVLKNVLNCSEEDFKYRKTIFMASITYPATNEDGAYNKEIISTEEERLIYIKNLIKLLKGKK